MEKGINKNNKINLKIFVLFFVCLIGFVVFSNLGSAYILDEACIGREISWEPDFYLDSASCIAAGYDWVLDFGYYGDPFDENAPYHCDNMDGIFCEDLDETDCSSKMMCGKDGCLFCNWNIHNEGSTYNEYAACESFLLGDGFESETGCCIDWDEDGFFNEYFRTWYDFPCPGPIYDCETENFMINPNATEICSDGIDNNCDGLIDCEDIQCAGTSCGTGNDGICCAEQGCVYDNDGDGFYPCEYLGNESSPCGEFTNYDCKDDNVNINPSRNEICNDNLDNNCNGLVDCDDPSCRGQINSQGNRCCSEKVDCGQCNYCAGNVCETVPDYTNDCSKVSCGLCVQGSCNYFSRSDYLNLLNRETSFNSSFSLVSSYAGICWDGSSRVIARECALNNVFFDQANSLNAFTYSYVNSSSIYNASFGRGIYYRTIKIKNPCWFWGDYYLIPVESEGVSVSVEGVGSINYPLSLSPYEEKEVTLKIDTTYAMEDNLVLEVLLQNYNYYYSWDLYHSPSAKLNLSLAPLNQNNYNVSFSETSWSVEINDASDKEILGNLLSKSIVISNTGLEDINNLYYLPTGENAGKVLIRPSMSGRTLKTGENFTVKFNLIVDEGTEDFVLPIRFMWLNQSKEFNISFIQNATNYPEPDFGWSYNVSVLGQNFNTQASWWPNYWYRYHYYYPSYWYYNDYYYRLHGIYPSRYYYWDYWYGWYYGWWGRYCSDSDICVQNYPWNHPWYSRWWRYWRYYLSWYGSSVGIYSSSGQLSIPSELDFSSSLFNTEVKSNYLENSIIRYQTNSLNNESFYKSLWIYASPTISSEYLISSENLSNLNEAKTTLDYYLHRNSRSTSNSASPRTIFTLSLENVTGGYNLNLDCVSSGFESTSQFCSDGLDNDCDGLVDCFDSDCCSVGVCQGTSSCPAYEICDDGIDNSGNGLIDCEDTNACCGFEACVGVGNCIEEYSLYGEVFSQTITNVTTIFNGEEVLREPGFRARLKNNFNYSIMNIENQGRELFDFEIVSPSQDVNLSDIQIEIGEDWISAKGYSGQANFYVPKNDGDCENIYECPGNIWDCNIGTKVDESRITDLGYACLVTNVSGTAIKNQKDIILATWHENDFGVAYSGYNRGINEPILFYTNISNSTDSQQILGAVCEISFEGQSLEEMVWDEEKSIYYSNFTFTELENYIYNVSCDSLNISVMHNLDLTGSVKTTPLENQSRLENLGENAFAYYAQMYIEYNNGGSWEYVSTVLNDSQTENLRILEVGDVVGLDTLWNPTGWNTSENFGDGTYRAVVSLVDFEGNLLYDEEKSTSLTTSFEFFLDSSSPELTLSNYTGYTNQSVSLQLSATDENGIDSWEINDSINFEINQSGFITNKTSLSSGDYWLNVFVNDSYGNSASGEVLITILESCVESLVNTSKSSWINLTCSLNQMNQSQFWIEYDENNCGTFPNVTYYEYQLVGPTYQNTTWTEWENLTCLSTNFYNQSRNLTSSDIYSCAENITYFEFQDNVETCDFCTPSLFNTSWTEWTNDGICLADDNQQQIRSLIEYDSNECNEIENQTYYEYKNITCDFCTPSLINTSASDWINLTCSLNQMNQSQFWIEYDSNECNEIENKTYYDYQLIGPTYQNTTFSDWQTLECLPTDYYNQTRNLTEFDIYGCAINTTYFEFQDNVTSCDFCTPSLANTSWSEWTNDGVCLSDDNQQQIRSLIEYDSNECNEIENQTYYEYKNITCDFCTPSLINTSASDWINLTCSLNQMNQSQFWIEYDSNECNEIENKTYYDYQLIGPTYQNTTFSDWQTLECLPTDYLNQTRNLTHFDIYGCAINTTYFEFQDNVETCDFCTPSLFNTSWTEWINDGICLADDNQQQIRSLIEYDSNECNEIENQTYYEYKNITCDFCTPSLINTSASDWINLTCSLNQMNQSQFFIEYDENNCNEIENQTYYDYQLIGPTYQNTTFSDWQTLECLPTDYYNQTRNLTQFDIYGCAINTTYFEYQDNVETCDFCTPSLANTSWSSWTNLSCVNTTSRNQSKFLTEYDENYESCYLNTLLPSDWWNAGLNITHYEYRTVFDSTCLPPMYCGDGICNNGETCSTCPQDCGSCGGGSSPPKEPEEPEVPEEPEEPLCEDECSLGEVSKTCFDSKTISEKTCGNYDDDECLEWGSSTKTSCPSLTSCSSGQCLPINCDPFWTCSSWGECSLGNQTRTCTNTVCDLPVKIEYQSCISCIENWKCEYTSCSVGDEYSFPYDCVDLNYCGIFEKMPAKKECSLREEDPLEENPENPSKEGDESQGGETGSESSCVPSFVCQSWGECDASYSLQNIVDGITSVTGVQRRECVDSNKCSPTKTESKSCELKIDVLAKKTSWCNDIYTEIYDSSSNKLLTRIKETKNIFSISGVNIDFLEGDFSGYCGYCYDGVKNYDEEEVDCGGASCPACVKNVVLFDWARITSILSWTFFLLLFLFVTLTNISDLKHILFSVYYKGAYFEEMFQYKMNSIFSNKQGSPEIVKARLDKNLKGARLSDVKISHLRKDFLKKSLKRKK